MSYFFPSCFWACSMVFVCKIGVGGISKNRNFGAWFYLLWNMFCVHTEIWSCVLFTCVLSHRLPITLLSYNRFGDWGIYSNVLEGYSWCLAACGSEFLGDQCGARDWTWGYRMRKVLFSFWNIAPAPLCLIFVQLREIIMEDTLNAMPCVFSVPEICLLLKIVLLNLRSWINATVYFQI